MSERDPKVSVFGQLRAETAEWKAFTHHAFVQQLGDGTLPKEAFLHYLMQDYVFLIHFSRAWALGIVKAETLEEMEVCTKMVSALIEEEMQLHVQTCAKAGIDPATLVQVCESPENLAYTRYVLEAGFSGDFLDLVFALAPCVMGYGEIGARLAEEATSPVYDTWIETYAGSDYQGVCGLVGTLLDKAVVGRIGAGYAGGPRWKSLSRRFAKATQLEVGFWDMGLRGRNS